MRLFRLIGWSAGMILSLGASAGAADYEIKIQRSYKAGQTYAFSSTDIYRASEKLDLPGGASTRSSNFRRIILDGTVRIDKLDDQGQAAAQSFTVQRLTVQSSSGDLASAQAAPKTLLDPGTELTMTYAAAQPTFALKKGGLLSDDALAALQQGTKRMSLSDALYGTKERKKIGDTWPLNKSALPTDRTNARYMDPALISGTVSLKAVRTLAGLECLQLDGSMVTKDVPMGGDIVPREATTTVTFTCNLPTDAALPPVAWSMKSVTHVVTEEKTLAQNTKVHTVDSEVSHDASWTPKP
jgi:hypothetical protein